jgi:hypothetical protein
MSDVSFGVFQAIYVAIAVPLVLYNFDFCLPGCPGKGKLLICLLAEITALGFFLVYRHFYPQARFTVMRTVGPVLGELLVTLGYLLYWWRGYSSWVEGNKRASCTFASSLFGAEETLMKESAQLLKLDTPRAIGEPGDIQGTEVGYSPCMRCGCGTAPIESEDSSISSKPGTTASSLSTYGTEEVVATAPSTESNGVEHLPPGQSSCNRCSVVCCEGGSCSVKTNDPEKEEAFNSKTCTSKGASLLFALLMLGMVSAAFYFCELYTVAFFSSQQTSAMETILLAVLFISVMEVINFIAKRVGRAADRAKPTGRSCEIFAEIVISLYYCVFYRSLFQSMSGWLEFILILCAHIVAQAFIYPVRMTRRYYDISARVVKKLSFITILRDNSTPEEWNIRMSIDFTIRFLALIASTVAYMISITFVRFGYNSKHYAFFGSNLTDSQFTNLLVFQTISTTVEIVAMIVTVVCTQSLVKGGIIAPCIALFKQYLCYQALFIFAAGHIISDVFLARLVLDTSLPTPITLAPTFAP